MKEFIKINDSLININEIVSINFEEILDDVIQARIIVYVKSEPNRITFGSSSYEDLRNQFEFIESLLVIGI